MQLIENKEDMSWHRLCSLYLIKYIIKDGKMFYDNLKTADAFDEDFRSPGINDLIARKKRFLSDHPFLQSTQDEIDRLMSTTLDPMIRLEILFMLISGKLSELRNVFEEVIRLARISQPEV